ncbi:hypothetical protein ASH00_08840 [Arthrobacter sp. Soil782]|nr:hypothetical protein ASH00_08840 [Arthrobacter sp. Soil782]
MENLRSAKAVGVEFEWSDQKVENLANKISETHAEGPSGDATGATSTNDDPGEDSSDTRRVTDEPLHESIDAQRDTAIELAKTAPFAGVIAIFIELEREVGSLLTAHGIEWRGSPLLALRRAKDIPTNIKSFVQELASLRNAAAHGFKDISLDAAMNYIEATSELAKDISSMAAHVRMERGQDSLSNGENILNQP